MMSKETWSSFGLYAFAIYVIVWFIFTAIFPISEILSLVGGIAIGIICTIGCLYCLSRMFDAANEYNLNP